MSKFRVVIVHREQSVYFVDAANEEDAEKLAHDRWFGAEPSDNDGTEFAEIENVVSEQLETPGDRP